MYSTIVKQTKRQKKRRKAEFCFHAFFRRLTHLSLRREEHCVLCALSNRPGCGWQNDQQSLKEVFS